MTFKSKQISEAGASAAELASLAARLVASNLITPPPHLIAGDRRVPELRRVIEETLAFVELCADALTLKSKEQDSQEIAASAHRIKLKAFEASYHSPDPTESDLAGIGEARSWESLSNEDKTEARRKLARAPIAEFLREAKVNQLSLTDKELGSIGEHRDWASIPAREQSNSIFRILTNHMVANGSDEFPALTDAVITEYGNEGVPVEMAETILWHLKASKDDRLSAVG
jgi:hypothetical protein